MSQQLQAQKTKVEHFNTLAIVGLALALVTNIVGLIISIVALIQIHRTGERGRGVAIAGVVIGGAWIAAFAIALLVHAVVVSGNTQL